MKRLTDLISPGVGADTLDAFKTWAYAKQLDLSTALQTILRLPIRPFPPPGSSAWPCWSGG